MLTLFGIFDGVEEQIGTHYPQVTGVSSRSPAAWATGDDGGHSREDALDPMRRKKLL